MNNSVLAQGETIVVANSVTKKFGDLEVLKGISMEIKKGEVICIIGPSGSGKSTFIRCINGLNPIVSNSNSKKALKL